MMPLVYSKLPWLQTLQGMTPDEKYAALKRPKRNNFLTGAEASAELTSTDYLGIGTLQLAAAAGGGNAIFGDFARKANGKHKEPGPPHYTSKSLLLPADGGSFKKCHTFFTQIAAIASGRGEPGVVALADHRLFQLILL